MKVFLNSYYPLCFTKFGRDAIQKYNLLPFIDGSCRREPDFLNSAPAITSICRCNKLIDGLEVGDKVIYITNKANYGLQFKHWRFVAILEVTKKFKTHESAKVNYQNDFPNNLLITETNPFPLEQTHLRNKRMYSDHEGTTNLNKWNTIYKIRAQKYPQVIVTKTLYCNLVDPLIIDSDTMKFIFKRQPCCQMPPQLSLEEIYRFNEWFKQNMAKSYRLITLLPLPSKM